MPTQIVQPNKDSEQLKLPWTKALLHGVYKAHQQEWPGYQNIAIEDIDDNVRIEYRAPNKPHNPDDRIIIMGTRLPSGRIKALSIEAYSEIPDQNYIDYTLTKHSLLKNAPFLNTHGQMTVFGSYSPNVSLYHHYKDGAVVDEKWVQHLHRIWACNHRATPYIEYVNQQPWDLHTKINTLCKALNHVAPNMNYVYSPAKDEALAWADIIFTHIERNEFFGNAHMIVTHHQDGATLKILQPTSVLPLLHVTQFENSVELHPCYLDNFTGDASLFLSQRVKKIIPTMLNTSLDPGVSAYQAEIMHVASIDPSNVLPDTQTQYEHLEVVQWYVDHIIDVVKAQPNGESIIQTLMAVAAFETPREKIESLQSILPLLLQEKVPHLELPSLEYVETIRV